MRLTTPLVTLMVSPPMGYPTTMTESCFKIAMDKMCDILQAQHILLQNATRALAIKIGYLTTMTSPVLEIGDATKEIYHWLVMNRTCSEQESVMVSPLMEFPTIQPNPVSMPIVQDGVYPLPTGMSHVQNCVHVTRVNRTRSDTHIMRKKLLLMA